MLPTFKTVVSDFDLEVGALLCNDLGELAILDES